MNEITTFHDEKTGFETWANENGESFWWASDLALLLGYDGYSQAFKKAIQRAIATCVTLEVSITDNFREERHNIEGASRMDYRLTRFACYLVAMNGDVRKERVAEAQAYFFTLAESFRKYIDEASDVEHVRIRDEVSQNEKTLASTAKTAGVQQYGLFHNAGYVGMYNMHFRALKRYKGYTGNRPLLDFMGKQELAANLFRITQTEAKIINEEITGQSSLEGAALAVGRKVRETMIDLSGRTPESLQLATDIKQIKTELKKPDASSRNWTRRKRQRLHERRTPKSRLGPSSSWAESSFAQKVDQN